MEAAMRSFRRSKLVRSVLVGVVAVGMMLVLPGAAQAKDKRELTVMTRNLYLGAGLTDAIVADTPAKFVAATTRIWATAQFTNFPVRAGAVADEIEATQPDLIGLQEVSRWLQVSTSTGGVVGQIDFLQLLQDALDARGLDYTVAAVSENANLGPFPVVCNLTTFELCPYAIALQDRDVILVRDEGNLTWSNARDGSYTTQQYFQPPFPGTPPISFDRGWASIDVTYDGKKVRFVNTHLETEDFPAVQEAQAAEFLAGPARTTGSMIVTGDFNSAADGSTTNSYAQLTVPSAFTDAWVVGGTGPGLSCCENETLTNYPPDLHSRIDLVLFRGAVRGRSAQLVGVQPFQMAPPLYASDHAGVVATLRLN
jgi:endonuclease/exonuclease/phosphatase family metal-dependent hydrolase